LLWACCGGFIDCVELLIKRGANINHKTVAGITAHTLAKTIEVKSILSKPISNSNTNHLSGNIYS
jgi:hypothetical protein